jgi:dTDP-4-amino-4,6-dideoxygalactose transaminase
VFGIGEGGLLVCTDEAFIARCHRFANFGFKGERSAKVAGINAKLSEYSAAVGLAALDQWPATRDAWQELSAAARERFADIAGLELSPDFGNSWVSCYLNAAIVGGADRTVRHLAENGIETRQWWGRGCHREPAYEMESSDPLPVTDKLAGLVIGLPFHFDLSGVDLDRLSRAVRVAGGSV